MQPGNDGMSRISGGEIPYGFNPRLKDENSLDGGRSDAASKNYGMHDGQSLQPHDVLQTPSSMMGSMHNLNTSHYSQASPMGQRKETNTANFCDGSQGPLKSMMSPNEHAPGVS